MVKFCEKMDKAVLNYIGKFHSDFLDMIMKGITYTGNGAVATLFVLSYFFIVKDYRRYGVIMSTGVLLQSIIVNLILKPYFKRRRPFTKYVEYRSVIKEPKDYSFPSGHTSATFAMVTVIVYMYCKSDISVWVMLFWITYGVLMAISRMYLRVHYFTDIIVGMIIGILSSVIMILYIPL